jgi:endoglucanase
VYQLYAIPKRDACAQFSQGGFQTSAEYLGWLDQILAALKTDAVFSVEADSVAHMVDGKCLSPQQVGDRQELLTATMGSLKASPHVTAAYLDAGHPEWYSDPGRLVDSLKKSGVDLGRGVAVNVSFYVATPEAAAWAQNLLGKLGGDKGAILDTSRNGKGVPAANVTGTARWCNAAGRGLGPVPTTSVNYEKIDAYVWIKKAGESDGACFGNPGAGVLVPALALELARNAQTN